MTTSRIESLLTAKQAVTCFKESIPCQQNIPERPNSDEKQQEKALLDPAHVAGSLITQLIKTTQNFLQSHHAIEMVLQSYIQNLQIYNKERSYEELHFIATKIYNISEGSQEPINSEEQLSVLISIENEGYNLHPSCLSKIGGLYLEQYLNHPKTHKKSREKAMEYINRSLKLQTIPQLKANSLFQRSWIYITKENHLAAKKDILEAIQLYIPLNIQSPWFDTEKLHSLIQDLISCEKALNPIRHAQFNKIIWNSFEECLTAGRHAVQNNNHLFALACFHWIIQNHPIALDAYQARATLYHQLGNNKLAADDYAIAIWLIKTNLVSKADRLEELCQTRAKILALLETEQQSRLAHLATLNHQEVNSKKSKNIKKKEKVLKKSSPLPEQRKQEKEARKIHQLLNKQRREEAEKQAARKAQEEKEIGQEMEEELNETNSSHPVDLVKKEELRLARLHRKQEAQQKILEKLALDIFREELVDELIEEHIIDAKQELTKEKSYRESEEKIPASSSMPIMKLMLPLEVKEFMNTFKNRCPKKILRAVGGMPRNLLLGIPFKDIDFFTDANSKKIINVFAQYQARENANKKGLFQFEAFPHFELWLSKALYHKKDPYLNDANSRDFTINTFSMDEEGHVYAPLPEAKHDLDQRLLRTIKLAKISFQEDPVRIFRAIDFKSRLKLTFHADIVPAAKEHAALLPNLGAMEINIWLARLFRTGHAVENFDLLINCGVFEKLFLSNSLKAEKNRDLLKKMLKAADDEYMQNGRICENNLNKIYGGFHLLCLDNVEEPLIKENFYSYLKSKEKQTHLSAHINLFEREPIKRILGRAQKAWFSTPLSFSKNPHQFLVSPRISSPITPSASKPSLPSLS